LYEQADLQRAKLKEKQKEVYMDLDDKQNTTKMSNQSQKIMMKKIED